MSRPFGYKMSEETKRKISEANTGKIRSEETKKKLSEIGFKRFGVKELHPNFGHKWSTERKERVSIKLRGKGVMRYSKETTILVNNVVKEVYIYMLITFLLITFLGGHHLLVLDIIHQMG